MTVLEFIDEAVRQVPVSAPPGTCWKAAAEIATPHGRHTVAVEARIEADGRRHEAFRFDDSPIERHLLLRLTCREAECPQAVAVRAQWLALHAPGPMPARVQGPCPRPLITEVAVGGDSQPFVVLYGPAPQGATSDVVAYEQTGVEGRRQAVSSLGSIQEVDEAELQQLLGPVR